MRNKIGPNTAPWGKPDNTEVQDEWCPPQDDALVSISKKAFKPRQECTLHTFACIFVKRRSCGTESKAFERSKNITSVDKPLSESLSEDLMKIVWQIRYFLDALEQQNLVFFSSKWYVTLFSKLQSSFIVSTATSKLSVNSYPRKEKSVSYFVDTVNFTTF